MSVSIPELSVPLASSVFCDSFTVCDSSALSASSVAHSVRFHYGLSVVCALSAPSVFSVTHLLWLCLSYLLCLCLPFSLAYLLSMFCPLRLHLFFSIACLLFILCLLRLRLPFSLAHLLYMLCPLHPCFVWLAPTAFCVACFIHFYILSLNTGYSRQIKS